MNCLTFHYDPARLGQGPGASSATVWGKQLAVGLGSAVRGAVLFLSGWTFPYGPRAGQTHDVVFVATSDNHVFAYAVDELTVGAGPIWSHFLGPPVMAAKGVSNIEGPLGVCSTPVLDPPHQRMFVMSYQVVSGIQAYFAIALDINTGQPIQSARLNDLGAAGRPTFDGTTVDQRGALNLVNGRVVSTYADFLQRDLGPYHGWVVSCNANNLNDQWYCSITKNVLGGGCWGPGGAAAAPDGSLYIGTGNAPTADDAYWSNLPAGEHPGDIGDFFEGVVKIGATGQGMSIVDWYQPTNARAQNADLDFGSSSLIVLPPIGGRELVVISSKFGIYLLDGAKLGHWGGELWKVEGDISTGTGFFPQESHSAPAHYLTPSGDHLLYFVGGGLPGLIAYKVVLAGQTATLQEVWRANGTGIDVGDAHGSPTIGAVASPPFALVWIVDTGGDESANHGVLRAFNALNGIEVYNSGAAADDLGLVPHYPPITCTSGGVFVGTQTGFAYYVGPCRAEAEKVDWLQEQLDHLEDEFASGDIPIPRTPANVARVKAEIQELRNEVAAAQKKLDTCRAQHRQPPSPRKPSRPVDA